MVAYGFKAQFVHPIETGTKPHTIRGPRRRHARPGEEMQLYYAMRTKHCQLVGVRTCTEFAGVRLHFVRGLKSIAVFPVAEVVPGQWHQIGDQERIQDTEAFARADGFADLDAMVWFWKKTHGAARWSGFLINWGKPYLVVAEGSPP